MLPRSLLHRAAGGAPRRFDEYYRCYPVVMLPGPERENVNHGGKVMMPPSALDKLTRLHITYPMMFELINGAAEKFTHAGVLEFIAEEGKIYLPYWVHFAGTHPRTLKERENSWLISVLYIDDANPLSRSRRPRPNPLHRPPLRLLHQTPSPKHVLHRNLRPKSRP